MAENVYSKQAGVQFLEDDLDSSGFSLLVPVSYFDGFSGIVAATNRLISVAAAFNLTLQTLFASSLKLV